MNAADAAGGEDLERGLDMWKGRWREGEGEGGEGRGGERERERGREREREGEGERGRERGGGEEGRRGELLFLFSILFACLFFFLYCVVGSTMEIAARLRQAEQERRDLQRQLLNASSHSSRSNSNSK